jgi:hypothetical protein
MQVVTSPGRFSSLTAADMVGPTNAKIGIVIAYDVMGLSCNTKQGADMVSRALNAIVFIPDLLQGVYADPAWLPPDTEEKREKFFGYLKGYAAPPKYVETLIEVTNEYKTNFPGVTRWGAYGLCWGGKVSFASCVGCFFPTVLTSDWFVRSWHWLPRTTPHSWHPYSYIQGKSQTRFFCLFLRADRSYPQHARSRRRRGD